ncbi:MAG: 50S ribosomal protein L24 [Bacteroidales bacterium]
MKRKKHIKKGDAVKVIAGEDKGRTGKVLHVDQKKNRAIVEGVNMVSKHTKPNAENTQGGILKKEGPVHLSNLMVMDKQGNATKTGRKQDENGNIIRYSKKSGEEIK